MNELTETFFSVAPCKLELLPQYSKLSRNADIHTVYGTDKEGHPICEIFRDNILKAAQEFFEKELCSQEETFFGEFPLSMFENKNIAKLIEHLKEKAELADRKEDEYHKDARMYAGAWEERLEEGIKEKFIVFFGSKFKALVEDAGNMRNDLCACRDILRPICFEDGNVGSHTDKLNWQGLDCDKLLETCEARSRFEMNEQDRIWVKYRTVLLTAVIRSKTICSVPVRKRSMISNNPANTGFGSGVCRPALCSEDDCWCLANVER